jgi:hypothetical protein
MQFLTSLENRFGSVDVVTRELLSASVSPLRSAVIKRYGGLEDLQYMDSERALMERTFQDPEWYREAFAHYPLVISAVEALRRGEYDIAYNNSGRDYEATQGISTRSHCSIYLAVKTEVIAIEAAIEKRALGDFYVSDLFDIFHAVLERSEYDEGIWQNDRNNPEFPTPYSYLLYEIVSDLRHLSERAVRTALSNTVPQRIEGPSDIAQALAQCWSFCVWSIADSHDQVSSRFRTDVIEQYLVFILQLGWEPSEIYFGHIGSGVDGLEVWRDLYLSELKKRFAGDKPQRTIELQSAMESLDQGKGYVQKGYDWLEQSLVGN